MKGIHLFLTQPVVFTKGWNQKSGGTFYFKYSEGHVYVYGQINNAIAKPFDTRRGDPEERSRQSPPRFDSDRWYPASTNYKEGLLYAPPPTHCVLRKQGTTAPITIKPWWALFFLLLTLASDSKYIYTCYYMMQNSLTMLTLKSIRGASNMIIAIHDFYSHVTVTLVHLEAHDV